MKITVYYSSIEYKVAVKVEKVQSLIDFTY